MKASQFIMAKGLLNENEDLVKYAEAIAGTELDIEFMTKEAGPLMSALTAGGKALMNSNVVRNAAIGTGVGAISGAANAGEGNRISGAFKGGLIGAAVGGGGTYAKNVYGGASKFMANANKLVAAKPGAVLPTMGEAARSGMEGANNRLGFEWRNAVKAFRGPQ